MEILGNMSELSRSQLQVAGCGDARPKSAKAARQTGSGQGSKGDGSVHGDGAMASKATLAH